MVWQLCMHSTKLKISAFPEYLLLILVLTKYPNAYRRGKQHFGLITIGLDLCRCSWFKEVVLSLSSDVCLTKFGTTKMARGRTVYIFSLKMCRPLVWDATSVDTLGPSYLTLAVLCWLCFRSCCEPQTSKYTFSSINLELNFYYIL